MDVIQRLSKLFSSYSAGSIFLFRGSKKALYFITTIAFLVSIPLVIKNLFAGYSVLAACIFFFIIAAVMHVFRRDNQSTWTVHPYLVVSLLILSLVLTVYYLGTDTIYWAYPISMSLVFMLALKPALVFNLIILVVLGSFCFLNMDLLIAIRFAISYSLTVLISGAILIHVNQLHQRLLEESIRDPMTGAYNRRQLANNLDDCLADKRCHNQDSAILMIDIDHFKQINDNFGHDVGDEIIKHLVDVINLHSRQVDSLFRVGGEEFLLLMRETDLAGAMHAAEKLRLAIKVQQIIEHHPVSVSIGVCASVDDLSKDNWMKYADQALYSAKESGRDKVESAGSMANVPAC